MINRRSFHCAIFPYYGKIRGIKMLDARDLLRIIRFNECDRKTFSEWISRLSEDEKRDVLDRGSSGYTYIGWKAAHDDMRDRLRQFLFDSGISLSDGRRCVEVTHRITLVMTLPEAPNNDEHYYYSTSGGNDYGTDA